MSRLIFGLLIVLVTSTGVYADTILSPGAVLNNSLGELSSNYSSNFMIDQSGLSSSFDSGVTKFFTYVGSNPTHVTSEGGAGTFVSWVSDGTTTSGNIDFDLGGVYNIKDVVLWQGVSGNSASVQSFDIFTSTDSAFSTPSLVGSFVAFQGTDNPEIAQVFDVIDSFGQYVRLSINSNYGNGANLTGLGEFALNVSTIPEPSIFAVLPLVSGLACIRTRKRR